MLILIAVFRIYKGFDILIQLFLSSLSGWGDNYLIQTGAEHCQSLLALVNLIIFFTWIRLHRCYPLNLIN